MKGPGDAAPAPRKRIAGVPATDSATEAAIADYLMLHPDFVQRHPELLRVMTPPAADHGNGIVDFQRYMVTRLQEDMDKMVQEAAELVQNARSNAHSQSRIQAAILALLEARSLGQMLEVLTGDLMDILDVDVIAMVVESNGIDLPHVAASGIRIVEPGSVDVWLESRDVLLRPNAEGDPAIYGPGAGLIKSEALLKLTISSRTPVGLVAFGSRDPELFQEGQGTELIGFLGGVLERLLRAWLELPA